MDLVPRLGVWLDVAATCLHVGLESLGGVQGLRFKVSRLIGFKVRSRESLRGFVFAGLKFFTGPANPEISGFTV